MREAASFFELYVAFSRYLSDEFGIPDTTVTELLADPKQRIHLPEPEFFESDPRLACEKMRLALLRVALPLEENFIDDDTGFTDWTTRTVEVAMDIGRSEHEVNGCLAIARSHADTPFRCASSTDCPVAYAKFALVADSMYLNLAPPEYYPEWRDAKISRNLAKLDVAQALGLTEQREDEVLRMNYLTACRALETTPKISD